MIRNTETDLHALLDSLTDGEHVKATWVYNNLTITVEGPVTINEMLWCDRPIRWENGDVNPALISIEVTRDEEVTVTRDDDESALHDLLDSLEDGETVTAEWHNEVGSMSITGVVRTSGPHREVHGCGHSVLRHQDGALHDFLHSVTVRRPVVQRWERDGDE